MQRSALAGEHHNTASGPSATMLAHQQHRAGSLSARRSSSSGARPGAYRWSGSRTTTSSRAHAAAAEPAQQQQEVALRKHMLMDAIAYTRRGAGADKYQRGQIEEAQVCVVATACLAGCLARRPGWQRAELGRQPLTSPPPPGGRGEPCRARAGLRAAGRQLEGEVLEAEHHHRLSRTRAACLAAWLGVGYRLLV